MPYWDADRYIQLQQRCDDGPLLKRGRGTDADVERWKSHRVPNETFGGLFEKSCEIGGAKMLLVISPLFLDRPVKIIAMAPGLRPTFRGIRPADKQEPNIWGLD